MQNPGNCPNLRHCLKRTMLDQVKECRCRFPEGPSVPGVPWKVTDSDRKFLRSLRIDTEEAK